jgi:TonB-linked SusC/RagA family outer membrane protein
MKINQIFHLKPEWKELKKIILVMKLSVLLLFFTCLQLSAVVNSQTVSLKVSDASLRNVLREINRQTGYSFFYDDDLLRQAGRVTLDLSEVTIDEALAQCFSNMPVDYKIIDGTIVLKEKKIEVEEVNAFDWQQEQMRLTGTVRDKKGVPLQSAAVVVKGTTTGASTDAEGNFVLYCPADSKVLEVSILGMKTQDIAISEKTTFEIFLEEEAMDIDEVQVIAYGTTTRRLNTGTVATVKTKNLVSHPVSNVLQALQGQVAGVSFNQTVSGVGSPIEIVIRGQNSFTSGTNPMIIVDGVVVNSAPGGLLGSSSATGTGSATNTQQVGISPLNFINPNDIESIDILKDADATSIYGSRGSNGVILITTKKAVMGETKFSVDVSTGFSTPSGMTKRLGTEDYLQMRKDAFAMGNPTATSAINPITPTEFYAPDLLLWDQTAYTDWNEYTFGNPAPVYNLGIQMTGGNKLFKYLASAGYLKKYDVAYGKPYQERLTGRMVLGHTSADNKFSVNLASTFGYENQKFSQTSMTSSLSNVMNNVPNYELYNDDGSLYIPFGKHVNGHYINPVPVQNTSSESKTGNLLLSADLSYEIIRGLRAKMLISYNLQDNAHHFYYPSTALSAQSTTNPDPYGTHTTNTFSALNFEPTLTYDTKITRGTLSLLAGGTILNRKTIYTSIQVKNPGSDALLNSYASGNPLVSSNNEYYYKFSSFFGRATYNWEGKYLVNLTYRRDGSSRFGPENKFGNFGSAGLGWIFSEEKFISNSLSFLSFGKLRGSYGTTGSDNIGDFLYENILTGSTTYGYAGQTILESAKVPNAAIAWEQTAKMDFGLELGFLQNRILFNTTWYRTISDNLLTSQALPLQTGYPSMSVNFEGTVQNTGMEFDLTTQNLAPGKKLSWKTSFNLSFNANKLISFPNLEASSYKTTYEIGRAIPSGGSNYLLEMPFNYTGVDPATGMPQYEDINGDGIISYGDAGVNAAWIGTALPTTWGGLGNYFTYKGFGLDFFIQFTEKLMANCNYRLSPIQGGLANASEDLKDNYWKQPGDVTKYPRLYTGVPGSSSILSPLSSYYSTSSAHIVQGTYFRLKNVQLTYTVPANLLQAKGIENLMFYLRGENLGVYTKQKLNKDPEIFWTTATPMLRTFAAGVQLTF